MLKDSKAFSGYSVDDAEAAKRFYGETLGLGVTEVLPEHGLISLRVEGSRNIFVYAKGRDHQPATYTVLNFPVDDIEGTVDELAARGVSFERYEGFEQDERGISRGMGPNIAWFKDPAGNILSVIEESSIG